jgi:hypothetical protein
MSQQKTYGFPHLSLLVLKKVGTATSKIFVISLLKAKLDLLAKIGTAIDYIPILSYWDGLYLKLC